MSSYKPDFEKEIQKFWKNNNYFKDLNKNNKTFSMILPPPNVTGDLHIGHAWDSYYPDLLIRYKQMNGFFVKWYPGLDHAGIATQSKIEKKIFDEKKQTRLDLGKDKFLKEIWNWKDKYQENIYNQWDKLGISLNYDEIKFTLDDDVNDIVNKTFIKLYEKNLIYKDLKLVNWDTKLNTAVSNIEVLNKNIKVKIYDIKYKIKDSKEFLIVSTTRPETIFGDVALCYNPKDKRYKNFNKKIAINPLNQEEIIILEDEYVLQEFGTGIMKVTPAHDFNDYKLAKKYNLEIKNIMNFDGTLNERCKEFKNLDRMQARKKIIELLQNKNLLQNINEYEGSVPISERSGTIVEPLISKQWFLKSSFLVKNVIKNQLKESEKIEFYPKSFEKIFMDWINKMEDWCISRQLWWGHKIPCWYKGEEIKVQINSPGKDWVQEEDVLDTWFSSALWPIVFSKKEITKKSLNKNFLSDVLFTGYDIIFFWVSRMIFQTLEIKKQPPFKKVIIHGLIRDKNGQKMSKSLGNGVNPIEIIEKWGSDVLRMFLLGSSSPGLDINFNEEKLKISWSLNNKIFNIYKLIEMITSKNISSFKNIELKKLDLTLIDGFILNKLRTLKFDIDKNIEIYNLSFIFDKINDFIKNDFSRNYLEIIKNLNNENQLKNLFLIFKNILVILHPFIPFLTEKIYKEFYSKLTKKESILMENYDIKIEEYKNNKIFDFIKISRKVKSLPDYKNESIILFTLEEKLKLEEHNYYLNNMQVSLEKLSNEKKFNGIYVDREVGVVFYIFDPKKPMKTIIELKKITKKEFEFELQRANNLLENKKFIENASNQLKEKEQDKKLFYSELIKVLDEKIRN